MSEIEKQFEPIISPKMPPLNEPSGEEGMTEERAQEFVWKCLHSSTSRIMDENPMYFNYCKGFLAGRSSREAEVGELQNILSYCGIEKVGDEWMAQFYLPGGSRQLMTLDAWKLLRQKAAEEIEKLRKPLPESTQGNEGKGE